MNANSDDVKSDTSMEEILETFPGGNSQDRYFNCLCVVFNEIISSNSGPTFV